MSIKANTIHRAQKQQSNLSKLTEIIQIKVVMSVKSKYTATCYSVIITRYNTIDSYM